jgi:hypothetical protein
MPRKKTAVPVTAPETKTAAMPIARPAWIDGPPTGSAEGPDNPQAKNWGDPYKGLVTTASFEMGENRRFRQRVFTFKEKPDEQILAALKENGFTYRANEKAWTIQADAETRRLSDELACEFAGQAAGISR